MAHAGDLRLGWAGVQLGREGGSIEPTGSTPAPPKRGQLTGPQNPTETDPRAREVAGTRKSAKNENRIFGISVSRGFRNVIICHVFGGGGGGV